MRRIDVLHLQYPFAGVHMLRDLLRQEGHVIGWRQVARLMRKMEIEALYRKPHLSQRHPAHTISPYRLRDLTISRPNHLWTDFCLDAVREAITQYGCPEIFNTDQGCQFTRQEFTGLLKDQGFRSAWTAKAAGKITYSRNDSGTY